VFDKPERTLLWRCGMICLVVSVDIRAERDLAMLLGNVGVALSDGDMDFEYEGSPSNEGSDFSVMLVDDEIFAEKTKFRTAGSQVSIFQLRRTAKAKRTVN